jgi:proline racemase
VGDASVTAVDYHAGGEPFRIVTGGVPVLEGGSVLEKRRYALEHLDHVRRMLVEEPRGHADMYGCFVVEPDDDGADLGVVFFHNEGYSTACGHGTIALATWAIDSGAVARANGDEQRMRIDVPSGRLDVRANLTDDGVGLVSFRNVPAFVVARSVPVHTSAGPVAADISYGGAFYASVAAASLGAEVTPAHLRRFVDLSYEIKDAIHASTTVAHPDEPELSGIYGVIYHEELDAIDGERHQRNVTVFADGEVDRSPCGSGTSARLALLADEGMALGETLHHDGIVGTRFIGRIVGHAEVAGTVAVITEVSGSAYRTGSHTFVLDPRDPLGTGFLLR